MKFFFLSEGAVKKFFLQKIALFENFFFRLILFLLTRNFENQSVFCLHWLFQIFHFLGLRWKAWSRFPTSKSVQFYFYLSNQFMQIWSERYFVTTCNHTEMLPWYVTAVLPKYCTTLIPYWHAVILPYHTAMMLHCYNVILLYYHSSVLPFCCNTILLDCFKTLLQHYRSAVMKYSHTVIWPYLPRAVWPNTLLNL